MSVCKFEIFDDCGLAIAQQNAKSGKLVIWENANNPWNLLRMLWDNYIFIWKAFLTKSESISLLNDSICSKKYLAYFVFVQNKFDLIVIKDYEKFKS